LVAATRGSQATLEVELAPLLAALGYTVEESQGVHFVFDEPKPENLESLEVPAGALVVFQGKAIEAAQDDQGRLLVNLASFCSVTGTRLRKSRGNVEVSRSASAAKKGPPEAPDLVTNGNFAADLSGWTVIGTCKVSKTNNYYTAQLEHNSSLLQDVYTVPGKDYEIRVNYYGLEPARIILLKVDKQISEELAGSGRNAQKAFQFRGPASGKARIELRGVSKNKHFVNIISVKVKAL